MEPELRERPADARERERRPQARAASETEMIGDYKTVAGAISGLKGSFITSF